MKMISFEKSVGAVVFCRQGKEIKYLLLQHGGGRDHWSLPKGHIEGLEKEEETLKRELREETGIENYKIVEGFRTFIKYFYVARGEERKYRRKVGRGIAIFKKVFFYLVETDFCDICLSHEHTDSLWLGYEEAFRRITYKKDREVLKKANDFLAARL